MEWLQYGHQVTVVAPTKQELTIKADITLDENSSLDGLQDSIEEVIQDYILTVQQEWFIEDIVRVYIARITSAILSITGVLNVENIKINDSSVNLEINPSDDGNPYPVLKEVILNEVK